MRLHRRFLIACLLSVSPWLFAGGASESAKPQTSSGPVKSAASAPQAAPAPAPEAPKLQVAVSPFANSGSDKEADYLGFQAAEFFASALPGYPGVQVIERTQLMKVLAEQELQLSGVTDEKGSVSVGKVLNARQMLVGSFELSKDSLSLNGRLVDVESGAVLSRATLETPRASSYSGAYKDFLFKLLSSLPAYAPSIGVEARIDAYRQQGAGSADDYAKALAALYRKDDAAALPYLQNLVVISQEAPLDYGAAADRYVATLARVKGSSRFASMVQKQVESNKSLLEQVEPLSVYRSTVKLVAERAAALLGDDAFAVRGDPASAVSFNDGAVSTRVSFPARVTVGLTGEAKKRLAALFASQDAVSLGTKGLIVAAPPKGRLLSSAALSACLDLSLRTELSVSIQFLDSKRKVVYELVSAPFTAAALSYGELRFEEPVPASFSPAAPKDGWTPSPDGTLEIQARELANLDTVSYTITSGSVRTSSSFPFASDLKWKSLLTHAYRKNTIKVASEAADSAPQFKEAVITDSMFKTGDPSLGWVPMLPRDGKIASFAMPIGVSYYADSGTNTVSGSFEGRYTVAPQSLTADFKPTTATYFDFDQFKTAPTDRQSFSVWTASGGGAKTVSVGLEPGRSWVSPGDGRFWRVAGDLLIDVSSRRAYRTDTGSRVELPVDSDARVCVSDGEVLYVCTKDKIQQVDLRTCTLMKSVPTDFRVAGRNIDLLDARLSDGVLYLWYNGSGTIRAINVQSGTVLWTGESRFYLGIFAVAAGKVFTGDGAALDARTGTLLFRTDGKGEVSVNEDYVVWSNGVCVDMRTGAKRWSVSASGRGAPACGNGIVVFGARKAVRASDGSVVWETKDNDTSFFASGRLFKKSDSMVAELDQSTGFKLWSCWASYPIISGDFLYWHGKNPSMSDSGGGKGGNMYAMGRFDLSVLGESPRAGDQSAPGNTSK